MLLAVEKQFELIYGAVLCMLDCVTLHEHIDGGFGRRALVIQQPGDLLSGLLVFRKNFSHCGCDETVVWSFSNYRTCRAVIDRL